MKTKKLLALLLAGAMSLSLLAGCGGGTDATTDDTASGDTGDTTTETTSDLAYVQGNGKMVIGYTVYEPMNYTDENGENKPYIMGCYGIGITRTAAAAIEKHHDDFGIIWPLAIAPYHCIVVPVNIQEEEQKKVAFEIYEKLQKEGVEVVIDDRDDRAGVKFKDADLIGFPYRITVGKTIKDGLVEFKTRQTGEMVTMTPDEAVQKIAEEVKKLKVN